MLIEEEVACDSEPDLPRSTSCVALRHTLRGMHSTPYMADEAADTEPCSRELSGPVR
jgi:hypothetical protein